MEKSQFSEHQIITILKSVETGRTAKDVCREHGISNATFYAWKSKFGGMEAADIKRTRDLEHENARLKQMYAEFSGKSGLAGCDRKKALKPAEKREVVLFVHEAWAFRQQGMYGIAHESKRVCLQTNTS